MPWGHAPPPHFGIFEWVAFFPEVAGPSRNRVLGYTGRVEPQCRVPDWRRLTTAFLLSQVQP
eukprot:1178908-Prorocentrum_minimum.AAC.2